MKFLMFLDRVVNAALLGRHWETVSSRIGYAYQRGKDWAKPARKLVDKLFFWQKDHVVESIEDHPDGQT